MSRQKLKVTHHIDFVGSSMAAPALPFATHAFWCCASTAFGVGVNRAVDALGPKRWQRDVRGTAWVSWRIGSIHQALFFPPLCVAAVLWWWRETVEGGGTPSLTLWFHSAFAENGTAHAAYHWLFFGYLRAVGVLRAKIERIYNLIAQDEGHVRKNGRPALPSSRGVPRADDHVHGRVAEPMLRRLRTSLLLLDLCSDYLGNRS